MLFPNSSTKALRKNNSVRFQIYTHYPGDRTALYASTHKRFPMATQDIISIDRQSRKRENWKLTANTSSLSYFS